MKISSHYIIATATAAFVISNSHALPSARCNTNNNSACPSDKVAYECDNGDQKCCLWTGIPPSASQNQIDQLMADVNLNGVMCYRSDYVPPTTIATTVAPTTTEEAAIAPPPTSGACLTKDECTAAANALGVGSVVEGVYPSKGCFSKGGRVFFSEGSIEDMSTTELPGLQERVYCGSDDGEEGTGDETDTSPTDTFPSVDATVCLTKDECTAAANALGVGTVQEGDYPSKGCFSKGGRVFFSEGSIEDMSTTELPGMQERIFCDGSGTNKIVSASTLPSNENLIVENVDQLSSTLQANENLIVENVNQLSSSAMMLLSLGSTVFFMVVPALFVL